MSATTQTIAVTAPQPRTRELAAVAIAALLFGVWGLAQWLYNQQFQQFSLQFSLSPLRIAWTLSLFNIAYFVLAIPAALFHRRFGYKLGLLLSLCLFAIGAFLMYFAIIHTGIWFFLAAIAMLGSGWAWFETCLNPLAAEAGTPETAVFRLNLVQTFNALGLIAGCYVAHCLASNQIDLKTDAAVQSAANPYIAVGLAVLALAFFIEQIKLPDSAQVQTAAEGIGREIRILIADKYVLLGALALAAYCLAMTVVWSATYQYRVQELGGRDFDLVLDVFFWFFAGRLIGTPLMRRIDPASLLMGASVICLGAISLAYLWGGLTGWYAILAISSALAITYPTVFATTIASHGTNSKLVSGVLVAVAGLGSAIGPLFVTPAIAAWPIRNVLLLAIPFVAIIFVWTLATRQKVRPRRSPRTA